MRVPRALAHAHFKVAALGLALTGTVATLGFRLDDADLIFILGRSLWAEDGSIFVNQSRDLGVASLWTQYAGYLHLYQRIFALAASKLSLGFTPWIFSAGSVLAVAVMMYTVARSMLELGIQVPLVLLCLLAVGLQPHTGESFFTLTNAQWFLAVALAILIAFPEHFRQSRLAPFLAGVLSLTGPFSALLLPVALANLALSRRLRPIPAIYFAVAIGGVVQTLCILTSGRGRDPWSTNRDEWMRMLFDSSTYGGDSVWVILLAAAFWVLFAIGLFRFASNRPLSELLRAKAPFLLLLGAACMYLAAIWAFKNGPGGLHPVAGNSRYFFAPYALLFICAAFLWHERRLLSVSGIAVILMLCLIQFRGVERDDLQFPSFAAFAEANNDVIVPIAPVRAEFPGWHIRLNESDGKKEPALVERALPLTKTVDIKVPESCRSMRHLGLEVDLERESEGWTELSWSINGSSTSYRRYYPEGRITAHYAMPLAGSSRPQLKLSEGPHGAMIHSIQSYCL